MRCEVDFLGEVCLQDDVYYGIQTERAKHNFDISDTTIGNFPKFITCLALIKKAAALTNVEIGVIPSKEIADAICQAVDEVIEGKISSANFPVNIYQGGGGVSTNMNINEVLANRANEIITGEKGYDVVHSNNHVNACQSTSDVLVTALHLTLHLEILDLIQVLGLLETALQQKIEEYRDVVKLSRTCLQDAVPITFAQEFSAYLAVVQRGIDRLKDLADNCLNIPMGATVVGTGLGISPGYIEKIYLYLEQVTNLKVRRHPNFFDALQNGDIFQQISATFKSLATQLSKMSRDLRILSSGNRTGMREIILPAIQPGSSFMPGKINPTLPELIIQISYQICGNDLTISMAVEGGELDLNVWGQIIAKNLFESCHLLQKSIPILVEKCIKGITVNKELCQEQAENTLALSPVIASIYGYDVGSKVAKYAYQNNTTIKQAVIDLNIMSKSLADELLDPLMLTDIDRSVHILNRFKEQQKLNLQGLIGRIDLFTREKLLDIITFIKLTDNSTTKKKELIIKILAENLHIDLSSDDLTTRKLNSCSLSILDCEKISQPDRYFIYLSVLWITFNEETKELKGLLDQLSLALEIETSKLREMQEYIELLHQEKIKYAPKDEELSWWEDFERLQGYLLLKRYLDENNFNFHDSTLLEKIRSTIMKVYWIPSIYLS
jgi:aspartate ammonia-lyase